MKKDKHVYCTICVHGEKLIQCLLEDEEIPKICVECFPFNPEDSVAFEERPNYVEKIKDTHEDLHEEKND